jgi:predicted GNAT superfamily acetyltransferase
VTSEPGGEASAEVALRDLETIEEFRLVVALERAIWGGAYDDVVPTAILAVSVKRGGILVGAFDAAGEMVGFVYSLPGFKGGQPMQWSHMLGVTEPYRASGLGMTLKLAQRDRTLGQGLELVEWTYDPLQAVNAHLNFRKLGVVVEDYAVNIYGESGSPLHGSTPTDRFIASWYVASPHVVRRLESRTTLELRAADVADAVLLNRTHVDGGWLQTAPEFEIPAAAPRLAVEIPMGYTEMLAHAPELAAEWRATSRRIFTSCLERGYRVVDFHLDPRARRGRYLLAPKPAA